MDNEQLLQQIGEILDTKLDQRFETFGATIDLKLATFKEEVATVIAGNCAELHSQIQGVEERLTKRLDSMDAILQESRKSWISGARSLATYMEISLRQDSDLAAMTKRLDALEERLRGAA